MAITPSNPLPAGHWLHIACPCGRTVCLPAACVPPVPVRDLLRRLRCAECGARVKRGEVRDRADGHHRVAVEIVA